MSTDKPRYTVSVTNEMFDAIEDFRFKNRFQTRSEATAELIRLGLEQLEKEQAETTKAPELVTTRYAALGGNGAGEITTTKANKEEASRIAREIIRKKGR